MANQNPMNLNKIIIIFKNFLNTINNLAYNEDADVCMRQIYTHFNNMHHIIYAYKGRNPHMIYYINKCDILNKIIIQDISVHPKIEQIKQFFRDNFN